MATTKARLLVQRYSLYSSHCAERKKSLSCPLCGGPEETMSHFLLYCPKLQKARSPTDMKIKSILVEFYYVPTSDEDLTMAILDPSNLSWVPKEAQDDLQFFTRKICHNLLRFWCVTIGCCYESGPGTNLLNLQVKSLVCT